MSLFRGCLLTGCIPNDGVGNVIKPGGNLVLQVQLLGIEQ